MPRKPEPSFELKLIIWDVAATVGKDKPTDIYRQLDYELEKRRKEGNFFEDNPDIRTVSRIVKEINKLDTEIVVAKLPPHVWKLRDDYEAIKELAKRKGQTSQEEVDSSVAKSQENHLSGSLPPLGSDNILNKHYDDLAKVAAALADNMNIILNCAEFFKSEYSAQSSPWDGSAVGISGDIVKGGFAGMLCSDGKVDPIHVWQEGDGQGTAGEELFKIDRVNSLDAKCLLEHFNYRFPSMLSFKDWHEANARNVSRNIVEQLNILTRSKNFGFCPTCPVCKDIRISKTEVERVLGRQDVVVIDSIKQREEQAQSKLQQDTPTQKQISQVGNSVREILHHDKKIFRESDSILSEKDVRHIVSDLDSGNRMDLDMDTKLLHFIWFLNFEGNQYISLGLCEACKHLLNSLNELAKFASEHLSQLNNKLNWSQLWVSNSGTWKWGDTASEKKYHELEDELHRLADATFENYKSYRAVVRETLFI